VHLLVCDIKWIFKMHGATIKIKKKSEELENCFKLRTFATLLSVQYSLSINVNSQVALHVIALDTFYFFDFLHWHVLFTIVLHFKNSETRNL
jgi:hypothetical protein